MNLKEGGSGPYGPYCLFNYWRNVNDKPMNIRQIAKKAGVSVATVSRVLNHPDSVATKTKGKIEKIMREEGYTPNWLARGLNFNKTGTIGLMIPQILNSVYMEIAKGVEDVVHQKGYVTFMCNIEEERAKEQRYLEQLIKRKVDGIVLISSTLDEEHMKWACDQNIPMVMVGGSQFNPGISSVHIDCKLGAEQAVNHLITNEFKKIAILHGNNTERDNKEKIQGYKVILKKNKLFVNDKWITEVNNSIEGGYLGAKKLSEMEEPPDAIFATSDQIAFGAMDAIKDAGLCIPEDMGVVGFDNVRLANLVEPKLTTVVVPLHKMGVYGARLLFDIMEGDDPSLNREILLQTKLKVRKSSGQKERIGEMF